MKKTFYNAFPITCTRSYQKLATIFNGYAVIVFCYMLVKDACKSNGPRNINQSINQSINQLIGSFDIAHVSYLNIFDTLIILLLNLTQCAFCVSETVNYTFKQFIIIIRYN